MAAPKRSQREDHFRFDPGLAAKLGLPTDIRTEKLLLGLFLISTQHLMDCAAILKPEHFFLAKHDRLYRIMSAMMLEDHSIDVETLSHSAGTAINEIGGLSYLAELTDNIPIVPHPEDYAKRLIKLYEYRQIFRHAAEAQQLALLGELSPQEIREKLVRDVLAYESVDENATQTPAQIIENYPGGLNAFLDPTKRAPGLKTGFTKLDEMTGGLRPGEVFLIGARPSQGKTSLAMNIATFISAERKIPGAVFSLEMRKDAILTRAGCSMARIDQAKFRAAFLSRDERAKLHDSFAKLIEAPLYINDNFGLEFGGLYAEAHALKAKYGIRYIVLDYIQLMGADPTGKRAENRNQEISALSRGIKILAGKLELPFIVLSQLSRDPEKRGGDHKPQPSDLRDSGSLEQDADLVAFIYREEVYKPEREDLKGLADLILAKQRNGPTGVVKMVFLRESTRFENRIADLDVGGGEYIV